MSSCNLSKALPIFILVLAMAQSHSPFSVATSFGFDYGWISSHWWLSFHYILPFIPAAVRKGYKRSVTCSILTCDIAYSRGQLLYVYRRDVMTQCRTRISRENLPVPLKLENFITRLLLRIELESSKAIVLNNGWLCTCSKIDFASFWTKKDMGCSFKYKCI